MLVTLAISCVVLPIAAGVACGWFVWNSTRLVRNPVDGSTPYGAFDGEPAEYL